MLSLTVFLMTFFAAHYSAMAFMRRGLSARQLRTAVPIQTVSALSKAVISTIKTKKAPKLVLEMTKDEGDVWVLQFDGGSRG